VTTNLGSLGGNFSVANGINDSGQVVGESWTSTLQSHAFFYDNGTMTDLGILPGGVRSEAYGINDAGQIVGNSFNIAWSDFATRAFLFENGTMYNLNDLIDPNSGWLITDARAINNHGQIAASGYNPAVGSCALLLTPFSAVPEPSSIIMFGVGAIGAIGMKLRRSRLARRVSA
jgi:probable HAF family extracellular repeat protein